MLGCFLGRCLCLLGRLLGCFLFLLGLFLGCQFFLFFSLDVGLEFFVGESFFDKFILILYHGGDRAEALEVIARLVILDWLLYLLTRCFGY